MRTTRTVSLVLLACLFTGCTSGPALPAKEKAPWERVPWEGMSAEQRDRTAIAAIQASENFTEPSCRWLKRGAWVLAYPQDTALYKAAYDARYIEMEQVGVANRTGTIEPAWRI